MRYVDGYVLPVSKKNLQTYRRMARKAGKIWREHGALQYVDTSFAESRRPAEREKDSRYIFSFRWTRKRRRSPFFCPITQLAMT